MTIEVSCECAMTYRLPDRFAGKRCRCRECGDSIRVPAMDADSESSVEEVEVEDAAPAPRPTRRPRPVSERTYTSESIHQMAPLTLSEGRQIEPPAARARVKKKRAEIAAKANAKASKQRVGPKGPDSEMELDRASRGGKAKKRRHDSDEEVEFERPRKKKKGAKKASSRDDDDERPAKKKKKAPLKASKPARKKRDADEVEDEDEDEPRALSPREEKRRQQLRLLAISLGLAALCITFLVSAIVYRSNRDEAAKQRIVDAKAKVTEALDVARSGDFEKADDLYKKAIAFIEDENEAPITDEGFLKQTFQRFKAQHKFFGQVLAARRKVESDPKGAFQDFSTLTGVQDEIIQIAAVEGLAKTNDPDAIGYLVPFANHSTIALRDAARRALIRLGSEQAKPFLAAVIREHGTTSELGRAAVERALTGLDADPEALLAIVQKATEPGVLVRAVKLLGNSGDPRAQAALELAAKHQDPEVSRAAQDALAFAKGEKP